MFLGNNADEAARAADDVRALLEQQEYEFQRLFADLNLTAIGMEHLLATREVTDSTVDALRAGATNLKHEIRNARHCLADAARYLAELENSVTQLDMNDDRRDLT